MQNSSDLLLYKKINRVFATESTEGHGKKRFSATGSPYLFIFPCFSVDSVAEKKSVCPRSPLVCVKAHAYLVAPLNYRAFDDGGVLQHDLVGTLGANGITNLIRKFPPGGAAFVDQRFPTQGLFPLAQLLAGEAVFLEVVELVGDAVFVQPLAGFFHGVRSEEHTSELQSRPHLVCRLLLEKKNQIAESLIH